MIAAADIMTSDLTVFSPDDRVGSVVKTMESNGFDVAPIRMGDHIRRHVHHADIRDVPSTDKIVKYASEIEEHHLVGSGVPVLQTTPESRDLLGILSERGLEYTFVVDDGIAGIITHADFNRIIAGIPLYQLISEIEAAVCNLINTEIEHDQWLSCFDGEAQGKIEAMYETELEENAELRLVDCLNTRLLNTILLEYDLYEELGFDTYEEAEGGLSTLKDIRDEVMHQRPVVGEHTFPEFVDTVHSLKELNENLANYAP